MKFILTFLFILFVSGLIAQPNKELKGFVKNNMGQTLSFSILYNITSKQSFSANQFGAFILKASLGDSILVSRISYKSDTIIIDKNIYNEINPFEIILTRKEIKLKDVKVNARYKNDSIAKAFANLMKHDTLINNNRKSYNKREMAKPKLISNGGIGVEGLIYKAWYKYSEKGKSNEKLLKIIEIYNQSIKIDDILSEEYIIKATGVNAKKAEWIKNHCAKNELLEIQDFNEYDLILILKKCAE